MKLTSSNAAELSRLHCLVHGDSGAGKTTSIGTLPEASTLIAVTERGLIPLRKRNYRTMMIETFADLRQLVRAFSGEGVEGLDINTIKTLVLDSLSDCGELCKVEILRTLRPQMTKERGKSDREAPKGIYDDLMTMEDWQLYQVKLKNLVSVLVHLPVHLICTSLSGYQENKRSGEIRRAPAFNGRLPFELPAYFDVVLSMESVKAEGGKSERVWRTAMTNDCLAKDATGALDEYEPCDWTKLFRKVLGTGKAVKHD